MTGHPVEVAKGHWTGFSPVSRTRHYQMEGNVARLRQNDGDDDENSTWNGNSTQQQ